MARNSNRPPRPRPPASSRSPAVPAGAPPRSATRAPQARAPRAAAAGERAGGRAGERAAGAPAQRPHRPRELGPRVFRRGRWWWADLRPWGQERTALRDPRAPGWPARGERTEYEDVARRWAWDYVDRVDAVARRRQLGRRAPAPPLARAVDDYLAHRRDVARVAPNTVANDATFLRAHLLPALGHARAAASIDTADLERLFDGLARQGYAPSSILRYRHAAAAFCAWAIGAGGAAVARAVAVADVEHRDARWWGDEELAELRLAADRFDGVRDRGIVYLGSLRAVDAAGAEIRGRALAGRVARPPFPLRLAVECAVATGVREAELAALPWLAFDRARFTARVAQQVERRQPAGAPERLRALKSGKPRTVLVLPEWWTHYDRWAPHGAAALRRRVLAGADGRPPTLNTLDHWLDVLLEAAGLKVGRARWHALRHTYARRFIVLGGTLEQLQQSLGHASIRTTQRAYGHLDEDTAAALARGRIYPPALLRALQAGRAEYAQLPLFGSPPAPNDAAPFLESGTSSGTAGRRPP